MENERERMLPSLHFVTNARNHGVERFQTDEDLKGDAVLINIMAPTISSNPDKNKN